MVSAGLARRVRQASVMGQRSSMGEDHRQLWIELAGLANTRGPSRVATQQRPRIATTAASAEQWAAFVEGSEAAARAGDRGRWEDTVIQQAIETLPTKQAQRERVRQGLMLHRAADLARRLGHQAKRNSRSERQRWMGMMEEANKLLSGGVPLAVLAQAKELADREGPPHEQDGRRRQSLTNNTQRKLQAAVRIDAERRNAREIRLAVQRRMDLFESNPGAVLRSLRRGRRYAVLDRVVVRNEATGLGEVYNTAEEVEARVSEHFNQHFSGVGDGEVHPNGIWAAEYRRRYELGLHTAMDPISDEEWAEAVKQSPRGKAPGRSGVTFELIRALGPRMLRWLQGLCDAALRGE
ncbi:hypothetical protein LPJ61_003709, partial [Coemansia biformis]